MTDDKMRIWKVLSKTDPKHTKPFKRAGGFGGTAMKPIWIIKQMTELFGPAGTGWGPDEPTFQTVTAGDEILVFCTVGLWYTEGAGTPIVKHIVYGVGGDKVMGKNRNGPFTNDEAFKAAYTDAMSNAMKQIGVGADIHMGLFEDEKYLRETTREFAAAEGREEKPPGKFPPQPDVTEGLGRWVQDQKTLLLNYVSKEEITAWGKTNDAKLKKLFKEDEPLWHTLKDARDEALDRVRAPL